MASPYKGVPGIVLQPIGLRLSPIQLELYSYIPIGIFFSQSEWLHSDQTRQCLSDQSNYKNLEFSFAWGWTIRNQGKDFSIYKSPPLLIECTFPSYIRLKAFFLGWSWNFKNETLKMSCWSKAVTILMYMCKYKLCSVCHIICQLLKYMYTQFSIQKFNDRKEIFELKVS